MEYRHIQKNISDSPRKLRLVADMIRKLSPARAIETLEFTNRAAAVSLSKAIKTAVANAGKDDVTFKSLEINEAMKLRRNRVGTAGRGRSRPYKKRWSHIKIVLTDEIINDKLQMTNVKKRKETVVKAKNEEAEAKKVMKNVEKAVERKMEEVVEGEIVEQSEKKGVYGTKD
jgi:large subunit ribosomal protein L22